MNNTFIPTSNNIIRKWYIVDCKQKKLGRISSLCTSLLIGKFKPYYHPAIDVGDYVILTNVNSLLLDKMINKFHVYKPGRPGNSLKHLTNITPKTLIKSCVYGMLPKSSVKRHLSKRLKIYENEIHPHKSQRPSALDILTLPLQLY